MFVPDYENGGSIITNGDGSHAFKCQSVPYGCWTASALVTTSAWASGGGSLAGFNNDYAFAVLDPGGKTGESKQLDATVGANPIAFGVSRGVQVYSFGYPQASPYDGQKLIYCAGTDIADTWGGTTDRGLNCNQTGGSSGGPWFTGFNTGTGTGALTSLNSFKYTAGKFTKYMLARTSGHTPRRLGPPRRRPPATPPSHRNFVVRALGSARRRSRDVARQDRLRKVGQGRNECHGSALSQVGAAIL